MSKESGYQSNALLRGLSILHSFDHHRPRMTLSEIADSLAITSSAAYRHVVTLEKEGYLQRDDNVYQLAPKVMDLGYRYLTSLDVYDHARLPAERLRNETGFTVHVAVLQGPEIVYVYRALSDRAMVSNVPVGSRLPAFATTMGRLLLSDLPEKELDDLFTDYRFEPLSNAAPQNLEALKALLPGDRARGMVAQTSHLATGTFSIAAPLVSRHGRYVAAMNLSGHEMQMSPDDALVGRIMDTASEISAML
ncbi:transcriptional regulator [Salipiger pallidus]|uniref:Transcriptional regulator n=1 Tax=Salipiger pallidus TaxID=1775170 RepID=A0A8J2ZNU7_9RHOB|nr:IclR family transcriptional regulator [Salipiger pallidus]GGG87372.1 transcriptional regulator [Salipiger pallidus]